MTLKDMKLYILRMENKGNVKRYCQYKHCPSKQRALPPVGVKRINGRNHKDDPHWRTMNAQALSFCKPSRYWPRKLI